MDTSTFFSTSAPRSPISSEASTVSSTCSINSHTDSDSNISTMSTANNRHLSSHPPINYNETLLRKLHGFPQVRILNNVSIPIPEDTDEETSKDNMNYISNLSMNSNDSDS